MNNLLQVLKGLGPGRLAAMAGVSLFLLGFLIFLVLRLGTPEMATLYTDMEPDESRQILAKLDEMKTPYQLRREGREIAVPAADALKLRIQLAEYALPTGSVGGYELFEKTDALGTTNFVQNINLVRALEGELVRTIRSIDNVRTARVHLVLPKREMFSREEQKPTASVVIGVRAGNLSSKQVEAIQKLVAAAVPKLETKNVSVMDSRGILLTKPFESDEQMTIAGNEERRRAYEVRLTQALQDLLERSVGIGKVRAEVNVEMDFDQVTKSSEIYNPDQQVVRSSETIEENEKSNEREPTVTVEQNLPDSNVRGAMLDTQRSRTEEKVNYEISKEVTNQIRTSGVIKKVSAAVMIDGVYVPDPANPKGKKIYQERTEKDMDLYASLVRSAVGFDAARGDHVEVINVPFTSLLEEDTAGEEVLLFGFTKAEIIRMAENLGVVLVAVLVILLVVRPLLTKAFEHPASEEEENLLMSSDGTPQLSGPNLSVMGTPGASPGMGEEMQIDELIDIAKVEGRVKASSLKKIGEIVEKHPDEALNIIRNWLYSET